MQSQMLGRMESRRRALNRQLYQTTGSLHSEEENLPGWMDFFWRSGTLFSDLASNLRFHGGLTPTDTFKIGRKVIIRVDDLNIDVVLEIFRHFVTIQDDGAFILTLVSTSWRELVIHSPILWQQITIQDQSPDWVEKCNLSALLARALPLHLVIQLPILYWEPAIPHLTRCEIISFEIPDYMTGTDLREEMQALLKVVPDGCDIRWYRAGREVLKETREPLSGPMPNVELLSLDAEGSEYPNYHLYAQTRSIQLVDHEDDYTPLLLLKIYAVLDLLRNTSNLRTLVISHNAVDPISSDIDLPVVTITTLNELDIKDVDFARNGSILPLVQSVKCPSLATISISGEHADVLQTASALSTASEPTSLILCLDSRGWNSPNTLYGELEFRYDFRFVTSLCLYVAKSSANGWYRDMQGDTLTSLLKTLPAVVRVQLISLAGAARDGEDMGEVKCAHHSSQSRYQSRCHIRCTTECRSLSFLDSNVIQEIDISAPDKIAPCNLSTGNVFSSLTTLRCTPFVLLPFILQRSLPLLQTIQLHWPQSAESRPNLYDLERELRHFDAEITKWFTKHEEPFPRLLTLGIAWFPKWKNLIAMLYAMSRKNTNLTLQLPAYPHLSIQRSITGALKGVDDTRDRQLPSRTSLSKYYQSRGENSHRFGLVNVDADSEKRLKECYYCWRSRVPCRFNQSLETCYWHCDLHSQTNLVSLTKDTQLEGVDQGRFPIW